MFHVHVHNARGFRLANFTRQQSGLAEAFNIATSSGYKQILSLDQRYWDMQMERLQALRKINYARCGYAAPRAHLMIGSDVCSACIAFI